MSVINILRKRLASPTQLLGRDKFVQAAVMVPCIRVDDEYHLLFQKRAANIRQGGEICFPGGLLDDELDDSYLDAAIRETSEELGISADALSIIGQLGTFVSPTGILIECFVCQLEVTKEELAPPPSETEFVFTLPLSLVDDMSAERYSLRAEFHSTTKDSNGDEVVLLPSRDLDLPERYHHRWSGNQYRVYVYRTDFGAIWGITGEILYEFIEACRPEVTG